MNYTNSYYSNFLGALIPFGLIPISEMYAWSNNQKIHILFHKLNEVIKTSNIYGEAIVDVLKWIEDNKDAIKNTLAEMVESGELTDLIGTLLEENPDLIVDALARKPELLANACKEQLETMLDDGTLNDVLAEVLLEVDDLKHSTLELSRKWRVIFSAHTADTETKEEEIYSAMQGACHFTLNNENYIAMYLRCSNGSTWAKDENGRLRIYREDGTFVVEKYESWGHGNALAFDEVNHYLYCIEGARYDGQQGENVSSKRIFRVTFNGTSIGEEEVRTFPLNTLNGVMCYNGELYVCRNLQIHKYNWVTNEATNYLSMTPPSNYGHIVGWTMNDDYIYVGQYNNSKSIIRINKHTKLIDWVYKLDNLQNNRSFLLGEIEGISVDSNNNLWVFSFQRMSPVGNLYFHLSQVFVQNLDRQDIIPTKVRGHTEGSEWELWVDNSVGIYAASNPNGIRDVKNNIYDPFPCIQEAIWYGSNNPDCKALRVCIAKSTTWYISICTDKNVWLENRSGIYESEINHMHIGGIEVSMCPMLRVGNLAICNYHMLDTGNDHNYEASVYGVTNGVLEFYDCEFRNFNTSLPDNQKIGIYINGGICYTYSCTLGEAVKGGATGGGHQTAFIGQYSNI